MSATRAQGHSGTLAQARERRSRPWNLPNMQVEILGVLTGRPRGGRASGYRRVVSSARDAV
jgi:hypothetical protein